MRRGHRRSCLTLPRPPDGPSAADRPSGLLSQAWRPEPVPAWPCPETRLGRCTAAAGRAGPASRSLSFPRRHPRPHSWVWGAAQRLCCPGVEAPGVQGSGGCAVRGAGGRGVSPQDHPERAQARPVRGSRGRSGPFDVTATRLPVTSGAVVWHREKVLLPQSCPRGGFRSPACRPGARDPPPARRSPACSRQCETGSAGRPACPAGRRFGLGTVTVPGGVGTVCTWREGPNAETGPTDGRTGPLSRGARPRCPQALWRTGQGHLTGGPGEPSRRGRHVGQCRGGEEGAGRGPACPPRSAWGCPPGGTGGLVRACGRLPADCRALRLRETARGPFLWRLAGCSPWVWRGLDRGSPGSTHPCRGSATEGGHGGPRPGGTRENTAQAEPPSVTMAAFRYRPRPLPSKRARGGAASPTRPQPGGGDVRGTSRVPCALCPLRVVPWPSG